MDIYIWGTGKIAKRYMQIGEITDAQLLGFIQTGHTIDTFMGKKVYSPEEIIDTKYDYILVCVYYVSNEIYKLCTDSGISPDKMLFIDNYAWIDETSMNRPLPICKSVNHTQNNNIMKEYFPQFYKMAKERNIAASRYTIVSKNGFDLVEKTNWMQRREFSEKTYQEDYCRYRSFELFANEIIKNNIDGETAELGVYKGTFSRLINASFPQRTLYLFDTFESFNEEEFLCELENGQVPDNFYDIFKNTSESQVLSKMIYPEKCVVKKGLFPGTAIGLENLRFAFVSIDVDFEHSVLEGLRFFYPRLNAGGAIFLHDYNNRFLGGVKKAVDIFEKESGHLLPKAPIADEGGTLIILKPVNG